MADKTSVCNIAISHVGISKEIGDVDTERSVEASTCRRFYETTLKEAMRDFPMPFTVVTEALALVTDLREVSTAEWSFSYRYPSGCMKALRIPSGNRNDDKSSRVSYKISSDAQGRLIYTDQENALLEFVQYDDDPDRWPEDFLMSFSLLLAFYIAPRVTAGDPYKLGDRAFRNYLLSISKARANAVGEEQQDEQPESEFITSRN